MKTYKEKRVEMSDFVICSQCIYWEECENKEDRNGCYFGVKEDECNKAMDG